MPVSIDEVLADLPEALALFQAVKAAVDALPKAPAVKKASDYAALVCAVAPQLAALIDKIEEQAKS